MRFMHTSTKYALFELPRFDCWGAPASEGVVSHLWGVLFGETRNYANILG